MQFTVLYGRAGNRYGTGEPFSNYNCSLSRTSDDEIRLSTKSASRVAGVSPVSGAQEMSLSITLPSREAIAIARALLNAAECGMKNQELEIEEAAPVPASAKAVS